MSSTLLQVIQYVSPIQVMTCPQNTTQFQIQCKLTNERKTLASEMLRARKLPGEKTHEARDGRVVGGVLAPWRCVGPRGGVGHHGVVEVVVGPRRRRGKVGGGVGGYSSCLMVELDFDGEGKRK